MIRFKWFNFGDRHEPTTPQISGVANMVRVNLPTNPNAKSVLIVDDDAVFVRATSTRLRAAGFQVRSAQGSSEAIESLRDNAADAVLMDISFPPDVCNGGMASWDGFQLMYWLRSLPTAHGARFIMVSSSDTPELRDRAKKLGAVAYLNKPLEDDLLHAAING